MAEGAMIGVADGLTAPNAQGYASPPDGGPPIGPEQAWPVPGHTTFGEFLRALNPLQHLPVIGMIYRAITGDEIQPAYRIGGSIVSGLITGGPLGALGTILGCFAEDLFHKMVDAINTPSAPSVAPATAEAGTPSVLVSSIDPATGASWPARTFGQPAPALLAGSPARPADTPAGAAIPAPTPAAAVPAALNDPPAADAVRMDHAIVAYARAQSASLAVAWQPAQDTLHAARGSS